MLELRKFGRSDFDRLISWVPDARFLMRWAGPIFTWPLDKAQLGKHLEDAKGKKPKRYAFKAVRISDNKAIGHVEVDFIDYNKSSGVLSRVLIGNPEERGRGYGAKMIKLAVDFGFNKISLGRIHLAVFDFNKPAISCYKKIGFRKYDFKREHNLEEEPQVKFEDEYWKLIYMKLRKEDYLSG